MTYKLTVDIVSSDHPELGGGSSRFGHMWYSLTDAQGNTTSYGFAPIVQGSPKGPGAVEEADNSLYIGGPDFSQTVAITQGQYNALNTFGSAAVAANELGGQVTGPNGVSFNLQYNGLTNSCIDFTWAALATVGIMEPSTLINPRLLPTENEASVTEALSSFSVYGPNANAEGSLYYKTSYVYDPYDDISIKSLTDGQGNVVERTSYRYDFSNNSVIATTTDQFGAVEGVSSQVLNTDGSTSDDTSLYNSGSITNQQDIESDTSGAFTDTSTGSNASIEGIPTTPSSAGINFLKAEYNTVGSIASVDQENGNSTSDLTTYTADGSSTTTEYIGPNGSGAALLAFHNFVIPGIGPAAGGLDDNDTLIGVYFPYDFAGFTFSNGVVQQVNFPDNPLNTGVNGADGIFNLKINGNGLIAGSYFPSSTASEASLAFIDNNGSFTRIVDPYVDESNLSSEPNTSIDAIDDNGDLIGSYYGYLNSAYVSGQFLYKNGQFSKISVSGLDGAINGINDSGEMTYTRGIIENGVAIQLSDPNEGLFDYGLVAQGTFVTCINDKGEIAGYYTSTSGIHGFTLLNGLYTEIDDPEAAESTKVYAINDQGQLLGTYVDAGGSTHNFIMDSLSGGIGVATSNGVISVSDDGSNFLGTASAAGSGTVLVDLKDGDVERGSTLDATLQSIQGVQLGADPSVVLGLTSGTDLLYGGSGDDQFYNEGATDYIQGGTSTNEIVGGTGTSIFYGNGGIDTMTGGTGQNFMQAGPTAASQDVFYGKGGTDFVYGGAGATLLEGGGGTEDLTGGSGYNELIGSNQDASALNILNGGPGTDVFYAGIGTNLLYEATGTDVLAGNAGTDYIYGGSGSSFVYGSTGTDVITTGAGNQYVQAGTGNTFFNDTAANLTAGRFDQIDNFAGGGTTNMYLPTAVQGSTSFIAQNGGVVILTAVGSGTAELFVSNASLPAVQANTHFTL